MKRRGTRALTLCALLLGAGTSSAETVYVIDRLAVGVHEEKELNSAIVKVLPTGTRLEVLARDEDFVQVRTDDGVVGWVDTNYVMEDKPAQLALLELEAQHSDTKQALDAARAEIASLTQRIEDLEATRQATVPVEQTSDALREMQRLAEENKRLAEQLAATESAAESLPAQPTSNRPPGAGDPIASMLGLSTWHWVMIVALMVLSFGFGGYIVDLGVRRRHGGFRI